MNHPKLKLPTYEETFMDKTPTLLDRVLEIHKSKVTKDEDDIDSHIENINKLILDVADKNIMEVNINFMIIGMSYYDIIAEKTIDDIETTYNYPINSYCSVDKIWDRIVNYYTNEGFDPAEIKLYCSRGNNNPTNISISWRSKLNNNEN